MEHYHAIFAKIWQVGRINWKEDIPTAAVAFNRQGNYIAFYFNPTFFASLNDEEKCAVIVHECLHILLNHGVRGKGLNGKLANYAQDAVINDMLIHKYGFDPNLPVFKDAIFLDKLEEDLKIKLPKNRGFEFYYNEMLKSPEIEWRYVAFDDHSSLPDHSLGDIERHINQLSDEEKERLKQSLADLAEAKAASGGNGASLNWSVVNLEPSERVAWKQLIAKTIIGSWTYRQENQWRLKERRFSLIADDLTVPSSGEVEGEDTRKVDTVFFMDVSGSCHSHVPKFTNEARKIPRDQFNVEAYAFDTGVYKINIHDLSIPLGGSTSFHQLEEELRRREVYPEVVFVMTDGDGSPVSPLHPKRWTVLLTAGGRRNCFPPECNFIECM